MRSIVRARRVTCALALSICVPAFAGPRVRRTVSACTSFSQVDKGNSAVQFTIHNSCSVPLACSIEWRVVCAPKSVHHRAVHAGADKVRLVEGGEHSAEASAAVCGDDSWSIDNIVWSCKPDDE